MFILAIALAAAPQPIKLPANINVKTVVEGVTYRVRVKGRIARVHQKTLYVAMNPETMVAMRQAARQATGCELRDYYFHSDYLTGLLDCSSADSATK